MSQIVVTFVANCRDIFFPSPSRRPLLDFADLYGAGAETQIFVAGTSGKYPKLFVSRQKNQSQLWIPRKPRKIGVWVSGAEIQTSAVDTATAVWVSTPEKFSKTVLGNTRNFSRKFRGVSGSQRQLCIKIRPLQGNSANTKKNSRIIRRDSPPHTHYTYTRVWWPV